MCKHYISLSNLLLCTALLKRNNWIENEVTWFSVLINAEVANTLELEPIIRLYTGHVVPNTSSRAHLEWIGIKEVSEWTTLLRRGRKRVFLGQQYLVQIDASLDRFFLGNPMDNAGNLIFVTNDNFNFDFVNLTVSVPWDNLEQTYEGAIAQADNLTRHYAEEAINFILIEVGSINENILGHGIFLIALLRVCWEERSLNFSFGHCFEVNNFE